MHECTPTHAKKTYVRHRRRLHPKYRVNPRWKKCWKKIADVVNRLGCDIADYVNAQFEKTYPFPHPNIMYSTNAIDKYNAYVKEKKENIGKFRSDVEKRFSFMTSLLARKMDLGLSPDLILRGKAFAFTPIFRVALYRSIYNTVEPVCEYVYEAKAEYYSHPVYEELYGDYIDWREIE